MTLDLSNLWEVFDRTEAVVYYSKVAEGVYANPGQGVANAYRGPLDKDDVWDLPAELVGRKLALFCVWSDQLGGVVPKINDRLVDVYALAWTVRALEVLDYDAGGAERYNLKCVREK